jgi:hypothetical protein
MIYKESFQTSAILVSIMSLISTVMLMVPIGIVTAVPGDSSDARCNKIDSSKTIGQVECCELVFEGGEGVMYCTVCDATNPPSNCSERYPHIIYKEDPSGETDQSVPSFNAGRDTVMEQPSDSELEQVQPFESLESGSSISEEQLSNPNNSEMTFNTQ